jgi:hypothetical protein
MSEIVYALRRIDGVVRDLSYLAYVLIRDPSVAPGAFRKAWSGEGCLRDLVEVFE